MQYLLLIHENTTTPVPEAGWAAFIERARTSGMFRGGSELGKRETLGSGTAVPSSAHIGGYMRFDSEDREALLELLRLHPVLEHGGTVELCEMPES